MKRFFSLILALLLLGQASCASAGELSLDPRVQSTMEQLLAGRLQEANVDSVQAWINAALADQAGSGAEWYVLGLSQSGTYDFSSYIKKLRAYLDSTNVRSAASRQKYALIFLCTGTDAPYTSTVMADSIGQQGVMSYVYGLHLLTNGCTSPAFTTDDVITALLDLQLADGGWAISGSTSDVDVTAMVLQALAPYADQADVQPAISAAVELLTQRQLDSGGFASYGVENPESIAQVLTALSALGIDALQDARFTRENHDLLDALLCFQLEDGSFSHTAGGTCSAAATAQVFYALVAYQRFISGQSPLYVLDAQSQPLSTEPGYKTIALLAIAALTAAACLMLLVLRKRHWKNFIAVALIALLAASFVLFTDFQTADSYYTAAITKKDAIGTVTLSIRCDTVAGQAEHIPADGVILPETSFAIAQSDTVYTILTEAARAGGIPMESSGAQGMVYIAGIANLYEYDFGDLSGWMYEVDGVSPSVGCDQYILTDGQRIQWRYTTQLGNDLEPAP